MNIELNIDEQEMLDKISKYLGKPQEEIAKMSLNKFFEEFIGDCYFHNKENDFQNEVWKDIPNFEGYYQASTMGRIRSLDREIEKRDGRGGIDRYVRLGKIFNLKYKKNRRYTSVRLSKDGKTNSYAVHRIIAITFINNSENKPQANHINGIKSDNRVENLSWMTNSENVNHAIETGLNNSVRGESHGSCKFKNEDITNMRNMYKTGNYTYKQIGLLFNATVARVSEIIRRKTWKHI